MIIHVVTPGETLVSIGNDYNLTAEYIQRINQLPNPNNLVVGQSIVILYPQTVHTVIEGDTIFNIAKKYGVTVIQILRNNPHLTQRNIYPGESIIIAFEKSPLGNIEVNGYAYTNIDTSYLLTVLPFLTYITIFTYGINEDGSLIPADDSSIISLSKSLGVAPLMHLSTLTASGTFSSELASIILNDPELQNIIISNVLITLTEKGYYGLDIDFEFVLAQDSQKYVSFIEKLAVALNANGFILIVALAPKISSTQKGTLYEGHDYSGLGNAANIAFLMTYEWGYTYGPPMAVAPINNVKTVLDYAITEIPPEKILMGIPTYGYLWRLPYVRGETKATSLSNITATEIASAKNVNINFDSTAKSPYYYFTDDYGEESVVWFEDARSIEAKLNLVKEYKLLGVGYWNVDRPFPQNWLVLNALYNILQVPKTL